MVNLFVFLDTVRPWRKVKVADRRTARDLALCMRELVVGRQKFHFTPKHASSIAP
jgi:hypothetical protein